MVFWLDAVVGPPFVDDVTSDPHQSDDNTYLRGNGFTTITSGRQLAGVGPTGLAIPAQTRSVFLFRHLLLLLSLLPDL